LAAARAPAISEIPETIFRGRSDEGSLFVAMLDSHPL